MPKPSRVLIVEDDPDGQELVATLLENMNIPVDVAGNAEDAEHLLYNEGVRYSVILIDLSLPGKDGWELLSIIQSNPDTEQIPCVAMTAFHTSKLREDALMAGFTAYFAKPIDGTSFMRQLESLA